MAKNDEAKASNTDPNDDITADLANATTNLTSGDANENIGPVTSAQLDDDKGKTKKK
jgi:hypothetical protein